MTIEEQMEISALLGIPLADILDKAEDFVDKVHRLILQETENPRQAIILMAMAYLYLINLAVVKEDTDILDEAYTALLVSHELLSQLLQQEPAR